jgi:hypothetical protein
MKSLLRPHVVVCLVSFWIPGRDGSLEELLPLASFCPLHLHYLSLGTGPGVQSLDCRRHYETQHTTPTSTRQEQRIARPTSYTARNADK